MRGEEKQVAHEYLSRVVVLRAQIESDREHLAELRASLDGVGAITYDKPTVKSSPRNDGMAKMMARLERAENRLLRHLAERAEECERIRWQIAGMDNPAHGAILTKRYLDGETIPEIAREMHYSEDWLYKLSAEALQRFYELYLGG